MNKDNEIPKTTTGGADRASGDDLDTIAEDLGGKTGIGEGGVVDANSPVDTNNTDEGRERKEIINQKE